MVKPERGIFRRNAGLVYNLKQKIMDERSGDKEQWLKDLPLTAEKPGFKPDEMLLCEKCARSNPPNRLKCFYCGEQLKFGDTQAGSIVPNLKQMEVWEKGFNIILTNNGSIPHSEENISAAAKLLRRETLEIKNLLQKERPLPIAKAELAEEAGIIRQRLREIGFDSFVWPDEEIAPDSPPRRLRGLEFQDEKITFRLFNTNEAQAIPWDKLALIVTGSIFEKRVASSEKRKKNEEKQVTESSETSHDEPVIDIYSRKDNTGWRIMTRGFDFSCVGAEKSLLAGENMKKLVGLLKLRAANVKIDEGYLKVRAALGKVWQTEEKLASHKMQRESMGRFHFDNVMVSDNNAQFTKYSRLQWRLLKETNS
jgi:hypothetical protein